MLNKVVHALCIWGHTYSRYANITKKLTFLKPRFKYVYVYIGTGAGGGGKKCCFPGNFA